MAESVDFKEFGGTGLPPGLFENAFDLRGLMHNVAHYNTNARNQQTAESVHATFSSQDAASLPEGLLSADTQLRTSVMGWLASAERSELVSFMQFMRTRHGQLADRLAEDKPVLVEQAAQSMLALTDTFEGSAQLIEYAPDVLDKFGIKAINSLDAGRMHARAFCEMDENGILAIAVANLYDDTVSMKGISPRFKRTSRHEGIHGAMAYSGAGFYYGIADEKHAGLLDEIGTEHLSRATDEGWFETFDPLDKNSAGSYQFELVLMSRLALYGPKPFDPILLAEAQVSRRHKNGPGSSRLELQSRLDANVAHLLPQYAVGGFARLNSDYYDLSSQDRADFLAGLIVDAEVRAGFVFLEEDETPEKGIVVQLVDAR